MNAILTVIFVIISPITSRLCYCTIGVKINRTNRQQLSETTAIRMYDVDYGRTFSVQ